MITIPRCLTCKHYIGATGQEFVCKAFPNGIPDAIIDGEFDHTQPYEGDGGIRFEEKIMTFADPEKTKEGA
ncbi:MAG TPA: hypothetical protein PKC67_02525 [Kiritimatiellia bacterium]|nr:hypothetical protein [Kiritimatiellia bacterium]HMP33201.1 hypothetical protein [Kiritimatiellia bacterium]